MPVGMGKQEGRHPNVSQQLAGPGLCFPGGTLCPLAPSAEADGPWEQLCLFGLLRVF